jgi:DNA-binding transcriptional MocR family regulator
MRTLLQSNHAYQRLAQLLEQMIATRSLRPGDRVPSVRQFSRQQRVSVPTALHAYITLETRGLIEARPRSGFFVRARLADTVRPPAAQTRTGARVDIHKLNSLDSLLDDHSGSGLVPLGSALPGDALLPHKKLADIIGKLARSLGPQGVDYDFPPGSESFRSVIARRSLEWGGALNVDDVIVTTGATEALSLALRAVCKPGDAIIVEMPTYFGLIALIRELGLNPIPVRTDSITGIDLNAVERTLKRTRVAAGALIPNFQNPVGFAMGDDAKKDAVQLFAKHRVPIIEDDTFGDLQHSGPRPRCLKTFDKDGSVLLCGSYTKTIAPGYRSAYIAPGKWYDRVVWLKKTSSMASATLPVLATAEFLKNGGYDRYLRSVRLAYRSQTTLMRDAVVRSFPEGIGLSRPVGGFLLWCELPQKIDALHLFDQARAAGISIKPGHLFSPTEGGFRHFIRLNCGQPWTPRIEWAVDKLGKLAKALAVQ